MAYPAVNLECLFYTEKKNGCKSLEKIDIPIVLRGNHLELLAEDLNNALVKILDEKESFNKVVMSLDDTLFTLVGE